MAPPVLMTAIANPSCANNDGSITATVNSPAPPLLYSIDGTNFQPNSVFNGLAEGQYTVMVKDVNSVST